MIRARLGVNMKKIVILLIVLTLLAGCAGQQSATVETTTTVSVTTTTQAPTTTTTTQPETTTEALNVPQDGEVYSAINGTIISEKAAAQRPLAVMMDNFYAARWQAGLNDADIVYEAYVEGQITRYMAVFQSKLPTLIGPIRSSRPYYLRLALEYDPYYAHVGGSTQAMADIKALKIADVDGLSSGKETFWRKKHKKIPNNMYGSSESLIDWGNRRKYRTEATFDSWLFGDNYGAQSTEDLPKLEIVYREAKEKNDKFRYKIAFEYDKAKQIYLRTVNDEPYIDEVTEEQLYADSIIVQRAKTKVIDSYGRLAIDLVSSGTGYYLYDGKVIPITWQKQSERAKTRYYTADGDELVFKRGRIWVQLVKLDYKLNGEEE